MFMRLMIFALGVLLLVGFVSAEDVSPTRVDFTLPGCVLPGDGGVIAAGACSSDGMWYCGDATGSLILYDTLGRDPLIQSNGGCIMEDSNYQPQDEMDRCCPGGYVCNDPGDELGYFVCNLNPNDCVNITDREECRVAECYWLIDEGICVSNPLDYSCSIYKSKTSCELDVRNVGTEGMGTDICGTYFFADNQQYTIDSCGCDWNNTAQEEGDYCVLGYDTATTFYGDEENRFRCLKDFNTGECIDGFEKITWGVSQTDLQGDWGSPEYVPIPLAVLVEDGCVADNVGIMRDCGEMIIRLPGFSLFALISSLGIIGLVYFWKRE